MQKEISKAIGAGHGTAILYAGALGLLISDILPTPADAIYFRLQQRNKEKLEKGQITPKQYWTRDAVAYYGLNPLWWSIVLGAAYFTKGGVNDKAKVAIGIIAAGAVVAVLHKNIERDETIKKLTK